MNNNHLKIVKTDLGYLEVPACVVVPAHWDEEEVEKWADAARDGHADSIADMDLCERLLKEYQSVVMQNAGLLEVVEEFDTGDYIAAVADLMPDHVFNKLIGVLTTGEIVGIGRRISENNTSLFEEVLSDAAELLSDAESDN